MLTFMSNIANKTNEKVCNNKSVNSTPHFGVGRLKPQLQSDAFVKSNNIDSIKDKNNLSFKGKLKLPIQELAELNKKYEKILSQKTKEEIIEDMGSSYVGELKDMMNKTKSDMAEQKKKREFYGDMHHELFGAYIQNQQLKMITAPVELSKDEIIDYCRNIGRHTTKVLNRYQKFIDNGLDDPHKNTPITKIFALVKESIYPKIEAKNIKLNIQNEKLLHNSNAKTNEGYKNYTIMANVIENAVKYSPENTQIDAKFKVKKGKIHLIVKDHGIGIPEADQETVLTTGSRGSNVGTIKGTGHGLYRIFKILEAKKMPNLEIKSPLYPNEPVNKGTQIDVPLIINNDSLKGVFNIGGLK